MPQNKHESGPCAGVRSNPAQPTSHDRRSDGVLPFDDCAGVPNEHAPAGNQPGQAGFVERRQRDGDRRDGQGDTYFDAQGFERRRGPGRRLSDFSKAAEEGNLTKEQFLFIMAIETFKRANQMAYPSWTDVLEVVRLLGYRKTMASEIQITAAEDWQEIAATPSNVRPPRWAEHTQRVKQRGAA
jgi:hypothetical protein